MSLDLLGVKLVSLYTRSDRGFLPSVEECKKLITSKTKAIALVTPHNPVSFPPLTISQTHPAEPDRRDLLTCAHSAIRRTSAREKHRTRHRRDIPRLCGAFPSTQLILPYTNRDLTPTLVLEIDHYPPLLVLQIVCHSWTPSRRSHRIARVSESHHDDARLYPDLRSPVPATGPCKCVTPIRASVVHPLECQGTQGAPRAPSQVATVGVDDRLPGRLLCIRKTSFPERALDHALSAPGKGAGCSPSSCPIFL